MSDGKILHFNITDSPSAAWTAQQLTEAFPYANPPRYLLRDRDGIYGWEFVQRSFGLGLEPKLIAPRSPWQNPVVERLIGSIRRECLDHVIVFHEHHLRQQLTDYSLSPVKGASGGRLASVAMMESIHQRQSDDVTLVGWFYRLRVRAIFLQRPMGACFCAQRLFPLFASWRSKATVRSGFHFAPVFPHVSIE